ncbi:hypothetical protein, partial [Vibrio parahaemolyticus]|uniref:hypothetical protein n=2 Tax=Vibrio harveyi group TaxID=717610 RepID=UPI0021522E04
YAAASVLRCSPLSRALALTNTIKFEVVFKMAKYQFFCKPNTNCKEFTYLDMSIDGFLEEKEALLSQGFEVSGDVIYSASTKEAVKQYKSNFVYVSEEYMKSNLITAIPLLLVEVYRSVRRRLSKR